MASNYSFEWRLVKEHEYCSYCDTDILPGEEALHNFNRFFCTPECHSEAMADEEALFNAINGRPRDSFSLCNCEDRPCCGCPTHEDY